MEGKETSHKLTPKEQKVNLLKLKVGVGVILKIKIEVQCESFLPILSGAAGCTLLGIGGLTPIHGHRSHPIEHWATY